jgi:fanconi anemia group J protein
MSIWCMNPACTFRPIERLARSVVVTSGTLSPMDSFESELGVKFAETLSTSHVVDEGQVRIVLSGLRL